MFNSKPAYFVELLLNLVWLLLSGVSACWWVCVHLRSDAKGLPGYYKGLLILGCILFVLFPVVSISDDVAQTPALAEDGARKQVLTVAKATELIHPTPAAALSKLVPGWGSAFWRESENGQESFGTPTSVDPNIENRPPPHYLCA